MNSFEYKSSNEKLRLFDSLLSTKVFEFESLSVAFEFDLAQVWPEERLSTNLGRHALRLSSLVGVAAAR